MDDRYVFDFSEGTELGRELLGGKGIGLAEMTAIGIPVPAGFTVTTAACVAYMELGDFPEGLGEEVDEHLSRLEETAGKRFGDPEDPLLVSVRSGATISMPGMMDTILNVGLNDEAASGGERFVLEINAIPGWQGLQRATGLDVAGAIVAHLEQKALEAPGHRHAVRR